MTGEAISATGGDAYSGASREAIRRHYDVGNEFFGLWLDPTLTYSCALWGEGADDLESAQVRKLDHLAEGAGVAGAERVLDVGCGWGSMLERLEGRHRVRRVTGLTLSPRQAKRARERVGDRGEVRVENWVDHEPPEPYDAIVSIGAFEHFATFGMVPEERIAAYRRFFASCSRWLRPGGRLALQSIVKGSNVRLDRRMTRELLFVVDRIFPESEIPWPAEMLAGSTRQLETVSLRNDADDYTRTCREWLIRLRSRRDEAEALVGPAVVADYVRYLEASVEAFERRHVALLRAFFERV